MEDRHLTDEAIRARAAELIRTATPNHAARHLGVNRITALAMAAGAYVRPATFAGVRERLREEAETAA